MAHGTQDRDQCFSISPPKAEGLSGRLDDLTAQINGLGNDVEALVTVLTFVVTAETSETNKAAQSPFDRADTPAMAQVAMLLTTVGERRNKATYLMRRARR